MTTPRDPITIVTGLPRSGTSLMMQMLEAGGLTPLTDRRREADGDNPRGYYELEAVKRTRDDATWLEQAGGRAVKVIHALLRDLPGDRRFRTIVMRRSLDEVVASQRVMLERRGQKGANLTDAQLIDAYERQLEATLRWLDEQPNHDVLEVDYNELMTDPGRAAARLAAFCDGLDAEAMARVVDPKLYRQRLSILILALLGGWLALAGPDAGDAALAYIGPGAGVALIGSFFAVFSAFLSGLLFLLTYPVRLLWRAFRRRKVLAKARAKRVVILGLDGLEPDLVEQFMDEGRLPHLASLRERGAYERLQTTCPPLSPVAWSSFSTGSNPGKHNIFDFIGRSRADYRPTQSSVETAAARRAITVGPYRIPLGAPVIRGRRKSKPFWNVLGEAGVFSSIIRVPITFPPDRFYGVQLSAMCTPDLRGTHGVFSFFTEADAEAPAQTPGDSYAALDADPASEAGVGGDVTHVERDGDVVRGVLRGPVHPLRTDGRELTIPFRVTRRGDAITLHLQGRKIPLLPDQYTDWIAVDFRALGVLKVRGVCRFLLKQFDPTFQLYCTPVQIHPERPVMPIGHPRQFSKYLSKLLGVYSTLGLAEDTWALSEGRVDEDDFLRQAYDIHAEREAMFFDALKRVRKGLVTCVFDAPDRIQHMFWRFIDDEHPAADDAARERHGHVIREMYEKMDDLVGRAMATLGEDTAFFVMSDHGFKTFRRGVDLNAWLLKHGYLVLKDGARTSDRAYLADVDWSKTRAYSMGLAGIFLNRAGREAEGIVPADAADALAREIADGLTGLTDPQTNAAAVHEAMPRETVYRGPYVGEAPDVVVGYTVGYRVSWDSVIGKTSGGVFSDNLKAWSGDHCVHPSLAPGVLFSSRPLADGRSPRIEDIGPTTLDLFGVSTPGYMDGASLCPAG